jgi:vesicle-associated membrane protein 7
VSYSLEGALYHVLISEGITYLCMADETFGRRVPFTFLEEVRRRFTSTYGAAANHVRPATLPQYTASLLGHRHRR